MAKMVGYACPLNLRWLKKGVQLLEDNLDEKEYKEKLNEYLSFEIESPTRLRKTREMIMNIWFYDSEELSPFRKVAFDLIKKYPEYEAAINLCLIYIAYPVVADICKNMGKVFEFNDTVTNTTMKKKLYDEWGERASLETTSRRVSLTLKEFSILTNETRTRYKLNKTIITNDSVIAFLLSVAIHNDGNSYYSFPELSGFNILFPFDFNISKEAILNDERFIVSNFGGEMTVSLKE